MTSARRRAIAVLLVATVGGILAGGVWKASRFGPEAGAGTQAAALRTTVNPNTAAWHELAQLPGIGPAVASRIVRFRNEWRDAGQASGPVFSQASDLQRVRGIGPKTIQRIERFLDCRERVDRAAETRRGG